MFVEFESLSMLVETTQLSIAMTDVSSDEYASIHVNGIQLLIS